MQGVIPGFNAPLIRENLRIPMRMAMPNDEAQRPEFVTEGDVTSPGADANGVGWDLEGTVQRDPDRSERVLCALTFAGNGEDSRDWGYLRPGDVEVVLLDEEYDAVKGFDYVNLWMAGAGEPTRFDYDRVVMATNLDAIGVFVLLCKAKDKI